MVKRYTNVEVDAQTTVKALNRTGAIHILICVKVQLHTALCFSTK